MDESKKPRDPALSSAFRRNAPQNSVLTHIEERTGHAPRVSLREESGGSAGAPLIDPKSQEKLSLPEGRGAYQLLGEIARGGMGVILKGHDTDLGRDVALKVLNQDLAERPEVVQRFVEEAQIGGQLQHPGIVPVYELGLMADERPYFTMKLVKGRTLATLLSERRSVTEDRRRMLDIFESICQTMGYAHSRGVIHRDIKPANIMVGAFGEVQVVDWGLAKVLARGGTADEKRAKEVRSIHTVLETVRSPGSKTGSGSDSMVGSVMGTPAYMPPEQAAGHVDRLDERSDVFSLGATLCEILTGSPPYDAESERTLEEAAQAKLDPALERLDGCGADPELVELAKQCLLPAQAARPRNAGVLAERIHEHVTSLEERAQAARIEAAEARIHATSERRARKLTLALAAAVLGIGVVGGGGWVWVQNERAFREREAAARERETAERERDLVARVNASLNEASALQGQELWSDALAALDRADALAETGQASAEVRASIANVRESVGSAAEAARAREARARETAAFVAELEEIGRTGDALEGLFDWRRFDADYAGAFRARGVDVDGASPDEVAAALGERGLGAELAPVLDRWLVARRNISRDRAESAKTPEDLSASVQLVELANLLDQDGLRADLREALLNDDEEMITLLAASDLATQPPSTIVLLGTALRFVDRRDEALRVLRQGACRQPQAYGPMAALLDTLTTWGWNASWNPEEGLEATRYARAALAVRPENRPLRNLLYWQIMHHAVRARLRGDVDASHHRYRDAVDQVEALIFSYSNAPWSEDALTEGVDPLEYSKLGLALDGADDHERALAAFRHFAAPESLDFVLQGRPSQAAMSWYSRRAGRPLQRSGDLEAAERCFALVLDRYPTDSDARRDLAFTRVLLRVRDGTPDDVVAALEAPVRDAGSERFRVMNDLAWYSVRWPREVLRAACARLDASGDTAGDSTEASADAERVESNLDALLDEVLRMAETAAEELRSDGSLNTLGVARYRAGDYEGAALALERPARSRLDALDWYPLAMAYHRAGDVPKGRSWYELALKGTDLRVVGNLDRADELFWLRDEAAALFEPKDAGR